MTTSHFWSTYWGFDWFAVMVFVLGLAGWVALWRKRFEPKALFSLGGLALFLLTLISPLATLANGYLFSAHMLQHLILLLIVPAFLLLGWPSRIPVQAQANPSFIKRIARHPVLPWISGVGAMWVWHAPSLCNAAATNGPVRLLQIGSLLVLGLFFWSPVLHPNPARRLNPIAGIVYLFAGCLGCTALGIIITFAPVSACPVFLQPQDKLGLLPMIRGHWRITPSFDQQIGGLLMWVPACSIYVLAILGLLGRWYSVEEPAAHPPTGLETAAAHTHK